MIEDLIRAWNIHNELNIDLLNSIDDDFLVVNPGNSRNIAENFAHMHNVRLMWLKQMDSERFNAIQTAENKLNKNDLAANLIQSTKVILDTVVNCEKIRGFHGNKILFITYLVSHESHHRGQIVLTLKNAKKLDKKVAFGLWKWDKK